jgi:hypothetical protein
MVFTLKVCCAGTSPGCTLAEINIISLSLNAGGLFFATKLGNKPGTASSKGPFA